MNMSETDWKTFCEQWQMINKRAEEYLTEYDPNAYYEYFEVEDGEICITHEVSVCGCCPDEVHRLCIDYEDITDPNFRTKIEKRRQERIEREKQEAIAKARAFEAQRKRKRQQQYEALKKEFG